MEKRLFLVVAVLSAVPKIDFLFETFYHTFDYYDCRERHLPVAWHPVMEPHQKLSLRLSGALLILMMFLNHLLLQ
jgi:hypothetical protein